MIIKNDIERANLIEGGKRLASVLEALRAKVALALLLKSSMISRKR